jgi:sporadic carbohydrate cluster protein (TIGR04323 family)
MSNTPSNYKGYVFGRGINGQLIPQRVQNLVIRNYSEKMSIVLLSSVYEYYMDHCYMMLNAVMHELHDLGGLIFYSTHMLPPSHSMRKELYDILFQQEKTLHFALEELIIQSPEDVKIIEDIILCRTLTSQQEVLVDL